MGLGSLLPVSSRSARNWCFTPQTQSQTPCPAKGGGHPHCEKEGVGMLAQLPQQPVLQARGGPGRVGRWGEGLVGGDEQVFAEGQAQHIQVFTAIAEGAGEGHKHWQGRARWRSGAPLRQSSQDLAAAAASRRHKTCLNPTPGLCLSPPTSPGPPQCQPTSHSLPPPLEPLELGASTFAVLQVVRVHKHHAI